MSHSFPALLIHYKEIPLGIVAGILFWLSVDVFTTPQQEEQWRLCMIGAFACLLGCTRSPLWFVVDIGFLCWNFVFLVMRIWG